MSTTTRILIGLALLVALVACLFAGVKGIDQRGYNRAKAEATAALEEQKREADRLMATETAKTREAEEALRSAKQFQDNKDVQAQSTVADLSRRLRQLTAGNTGRLRDPNAPECGRGGGGTEAQAATTARAGPEDGAQAGGLLSEQLSELLQRHAAEADSINAAYASCRADAFAMRQSLDD